MNMNFTDTLQSSTTELKYAKDSVTGTAKCVSSHETGKSKSQNNNVHG